jgi:myo-inositol-1(or 4)-monophosphatase
VRAGSELTKALEVVRNAVQTGAMLLDEMLRLPTEQLFIRYKAQDGDSPSSLIGLRISEEIHSIIRQKFPDHLIIDEELGVSGKLNSSYKWYVDPDDGSSNAEHDLHGITVGVTLERDDEPLMAGIGDYWDKTVLFAQKGRGAYIDHFAASGKRRPKRIKVSEREVFYRRYFLDDGYSNNFNREPKGRFESFMRDSSRQVGPGCMWMRSYGSMILHWKLLASGRVDVVLGDSVGGPWDTKPGKLIVPEAGGHIHEINGGHAILGTSGVFHDEIVEKFVEYYKDYPGFRGPKTSTAPHA